MYGHSLLQYPAILPSHQSNRKIATQLTSVGLAHTRPILTWSQLYSTVLCVWHNKVKGWPCVSSSSSLSQMYRQDCSFVEHENHVAVPKYCSIVYVVPHSKLCMFHSGFGLLLLSCKRVPCVEHLIPYSGKLWGRKLLQIGEKYDFHGENVRGLLAFAAPKVPHSQISVRKRTQMATKLRNSQNFSPRKFPAKFAWLYMHILSRYNLLQL